MSGFGADSNETYSGDEQLSVDILNSGNGGENSLTVGTTAIELKVGASRLEGRKLLTIFNNSNDTIYWGFSSGVTTSSGTPIFKNQMYSWSVGDNQGVYLIAGSAGNNCRITEA